MISLNLPASVYTAYRGYAWSAVPAGVALDQLNALYRYVSQARGDFPDPLAVETGIVSDGRLAGVYAIQNVDKWDAEGRAADYAAFVFFPIALAHKIDFVALLSTDFFWTPERTPRTSVVYAGSEASPLDPAAIEALKSTHSHILTDPRSVGSLLAVCGKNARHWIGRMQTDGTMAVACDAWTV